MVLIEELQMFISISLFFSDNRKRGLRRWLTHQSIMGFSNGALRVVLVLVAMFFVVYIFGLGLFSKGSSNDAQASCSCDCNCSEVEISWTLEFINNSYPECGKHDPEISEEMKKGVADLISEEIGLQKRVANETLEQTWNSVISARRVSLQYETEAQKCSAHTEACEAGRERAEAGLVEEPHVIASSCNICTYRTSLYPAKKIKTALLFFGRGKVKQNH
ncbi:hypothetical protein OIU84_017976 [Salix udensis]|uniref:Uncharacterized protein n=1 Tax=Salix udensis TaxID=889485 RepID=A0AAD6L3B4_9ROSI|nr:hypothetical protein OIU84_017976 [Salix udensis]